MGKRVFAGVVAFIFLVIGGLALFYVFSHSFHASVLVFGLVFVGVGVFEAYRAFPRRFGAQDETDDDSDENESGW